MRLRRKQIKLKNGETLVLTSPKIENAQEMADYYNTMITETRFVESDILDSKTTMESQEKWINQSLNDEKSLIVIAQIGGKIVGMGNINPKGTKRVRYRHVCLIGVSVLKQFWGLKIASAIINELINFAKKTGYEQIELDVVSTNEGAIHLYKKFGFVEEGHLTHAMKYTMEQLQILLKCKNF